jgi:hypothetical protein
MEKKQPIKGFQMDLSMRILFMALPTGDVQGFGFGLAGRSLASKGSVTPDCNEEGRVVVAITVDRSGKVIAADPGVKGSTNNAPCLLAPAKATALMYQWAPDAQAPEKQIGFVVINFKLGGTAMMHYKEATQWLFEQLPMYQQKGASALNAKLDGIKKFCNYLGEPHQKFKSIHVAGTNGKGSSSHMLAAILQEAGYKVGLYTSPHLKDFRERIKINGQEIPEEEVVSFVYSHKDYMSQNALSFFEMTVAMAFDYFASAEVDIAIIEVGLGGRLDATNIIRPEVSLITNIGFDHMDLLGNTLAQIAIEKAGIIKPNVPVVISEWHRDTEAVFKAKSAAVGAPYLFCQ